MNELPCVQVSFFFTGNEIDLESITKEIGIKHTTASKLLKSYCFLEREEPQFLKQDFLSRNRPADMPSYESVNLLRLAKANKEITESDYKRIRESTLDKGKEMEHKVFMTEERRASLITERNRRRSERKVAALRGKDKSFNMIKLPKGMKLVKSEKWKEAATERQLLWLQREGYEIFENEYTKGQCAEIIGSFEASKSKKAELKSA